MPTLPESFSRFRSFVSILPSLVFRSFVSILPLLLTEQEKRRLEKIRIRQEREMQQQIEKEVKVSQGLTFPA